MGFHRGNGTATVTPSVRKFPSPGQYIKIGKRSADSGAKKVSFAIARHLHTRVLRDRVDRLPRLHSNVRLTDKNEVLTDIKANISDTLLQLIRTNGGTIINYFPQDHAIRALIPVTTVENIAANAEVKFIGKAALCTTQKVNYSEGDIAHNAPLVRSKKYNGAGVKVGVLSDSVDYLSQVQATGDLPATVTVLEDAPGNSGEGTAMLEIVYDLAPAATLYFATAWNGPASFANNIIGLMNVGCKVIVDDVTYFNESPFQDDVISKAVNTVTAAGVLYFSSAGNKGNLKAGTSGTWEGDYVDGGSVSKLTHVHAFAPGVMMNKIVQNPYVVTLSWSDPLGGSGNDYDLYIVDGSGNIRAYSAEWQTGAQDPFEEIGVSAYGHNYSGYYIVVSKYSGSGRFLHLNAFTNSGLPYGGLQFATHGSTWGHATADEAFGVSAVSAFHRDTPFTGSESLEVFTGDGPRRIFYNPDGTPVTPGNFSSSGGRVRNKPDITAADGVACVTPGFNPFYGTSAAAPHAAAIAALLLSANPHATTAHIRHALTGPHCQWMQLGTQLPDLALLWLTGH